LEQKLQEKERLLAQATAELAASKAELERWRNGGINEKPHESQEMSYDTVQGDAPSSTTGDTTADADLGMATRPMDPQETLLDTWVLDYSPAISLITASTPELPLSINTLSGTPSWLSNSIFLQSQYPFNHTPSRSPPSCCESVDDLSVPSISEDVTQPESDPELHRILLPPTPSFCSIYPPADAESTTLCSQAFVLISQQNFRGVDAHTIRSWLYEGFRLARNQSEGCRVDNKLLFGLLDFISSP